MKHWPIRCSFLDVLLRHERAPPPLAGSQHRHCNQGDGGYSRGQEEGLLLQHRLIPRHRIVPRVTTTLEMGRCSPARHLEEMSHAARSLLVKLSNDSISLSEGGSACSAME